MKNCQYKNGPENYILGIYKNNTDICDALRDLVPFLQFKKSQKHQSRIVTFSKVAG